jgi:molybdopterin biosynthesis enzyme
VNAHHMTLPGFVTPPGSQSAALRHWRWCSAPAASTSRMTALRPPRSTGESRTCPGQGQDPILIADALQQAAAGHDFILASGGVSTGEADHVKAGVENAGKLTFWRVAIKPGRPIAMGSIDGVPFMGLPGNPVASFVTFVYLARAAVLALAGAVSEPFTAMPVRAAFTYRKKAGRREYARAKIRRGADGALEA